jgi:[calcium/calmodulin-dependent protein kinase] kinase
MKIISKDFRRKKKGAGSETYFEDIRREIAIMKKLLHPNVLQLYEVLDDPKVNKLYLVLEYMKRGDLYKVLSDRQKQVTEAHTQQISTIGSGDNLVVDTSFNSTFFTEYELWNIFKQVLAGLRYLHHQTVAALAEQ